MTQFMYQCPKCEFIQEGLDDCRKCDNSHKYLEKIVVYTAEDMKEITRKK